MGEKIYRLLGYLFITVGNPTTIRKRGSPSDTSTPGLPWAAWISSSGDWRVDTVPRRQHGFGATWQNLSGIAYVRIVRRGSCCDDRVVGWMDGWM